MRKKTKLANSLLFVAVFLAVEYWVSREDVLQADASEQVKVVDGDSLEIGSRRIRLAGIDSPEYKQTCYDADKRKYSCGIKAKEYMQKLVAGGGVKCVEKSLDRYKRSLSVCYADNLNLNKEMVAAGWAVAYRDDDGLYTLVEQKAKLQKKGIWQGRFMRPELYRRQNRQDKS